MKTFWLVGTSVSKCFIAHNTAGRGGGGEVRLNWVSNNNTSPLSLPKESFSYMSVLIRLALDSHEIYISGGRKKTTWSMNGIAPIHHNYPRKITESQYISY